MKTENEIALEQALKDNASSRDMFDALIKTPEAKIADEAKPKLRDGDYGICGNQQWAHIHGQTFWTDEKFSNPRNRISELTDSHFIENSPSILNFADDLTALQEEVTDKWIKFVTDTAGNCVDLKVQLTEKAVWLYSSNGRGVQLKAEKLSRLILKLRQMEATLKRREAKG
jgi:hypothetical protein